MYRFDYSFESIMGKFKTLEDIQDYINKNNIKTIKDFKKHTTAFKSIWSLKLSIYDLVFENETKLYKNHFTKILKTKEDFQHYIDENIEYSSKLYKNENYIFFDYMIGCGYTIKDFDFKIDNRRKDISHINTIEDFLKEINNLGLLSVSDFTKNTIYLYNKFKSLGYNTKDLVFPYMNRNMSISEKKTLRFLEDNNIDKLYETEKRFPDLRDKKPLRLDFYSEKYKLALEPGGPQHILEEIKVHDSDLPKDRFSVRMKHDQMKRDYCKQHNIHIIYYFDLPNSLKLKEKALKVLETYPGEWYIDFDEYCQAILNYMENYNKENSSQ